jgi:hypothetical protein
MTPLLCAVALLACDAWVLVRDENHVTMNGDLKDLAPAQKFLKKIGPGYLWVRHGGRQYLIRDGKVLEEVEKAAHADVAVDEREAALDEQEQELDRHQQKIDRHQAALEEWEDASGAERQLQKAQAELQRAQELVNEAQRKIGREQERLGQAAEKAAREGDRRVAELIETALRDGTAKEVK